MSKKKNTNKAKDKKNIDKEILKQFTSATSMVVIDHLKDMDVSNLFTDIYVRVTDSDIAYLNKQYEKQMLYAVTIPEKFDKTLHSFYLQMADYIKEKNLYKKFYQLCYDTYSQLMMKKELGENAMDAYQDILMQQAAYFLGTAEKCVYAIDSKTGKPIYTSEPGQNLTIINHEIFKIMENSGSIKDVLALFTRYGIKNVNSMRDAEKLVYADQILGNMLFFMTHFLNEETKDIIRRPFRDPTEPLQFNPIFTRKYDKDKFFKKLSLRETLLPAEGISMDFENCGDFLELYMEEIFEQDSIIMLWRLKMTDGTYISGFFDTSKELLFSPWRESNGKKLYHEPLEYFILQNYMYLTCSLTPEEKTMFYHFKELNDTNKKQKDNILPSVYYSIRTPSKGKHGDGIPRHFDRKLYIQEIISIQPFLRSLPLGAIASDEATEMARKLGITLPKGKTLVRGFKRKSWHTDKKEEDL